MRAGVFDGLDENIPTIRIPTETKEIGTRVLSKSDASTLTEWNGITLERQTCEIIQ